MAEIIMQYLFIVLLVIGLAYLIYLLKDKGVSIKDDYFGIAYTLLNALNNDELTNENIKKILRLISKSVQYIEVSFENEDNSIKEEKAFRLSKEALGTLNFNNNIEDESIRQLIRMTAALLPPTNKQQ